MINKIKKIFQKNKLSILIALFIIIVGVLVFLIIIKLNNKTIIKKYENDYYVLQYDNGWLLKEKEQKTILLERNKDSQLEIEIVYLQDEMRYSDIDDLIDEVIFNIEKQNFNYKLISKRDSTLSKYEYKGYKLLFEDGNVQVMVSLYKKGDKLIIFTYESSNQYFDILLDSVQNIIYNFDIKEKVYDLSNNIKIDTSEVSYSLNPELDQKMLETKSYEVAANNYYVKYMVPSSFQISGFDSSRNYFNYRGIGDKNITISTNIYKKNVYEYLDKESTANVYKNYEKFKDKDYSNYKETLTKIDRNIETYLYKNSYNYDKVLTYDKEFNSKEYSRKDENALLIFALDKNHIMIVEIKSTGLAITQKLVDSIKIEKIINYSSYIKVKKENNSLISELKRYDEYGKNKITQIVLNVPDKYKAYEYNNDNIYSNRYFGLNYDDEKNYYDYQIHYELTSANTKIESKVKNISSTFTDAYGRRNNLTYFKEINKNNKKFVIYTGGYTQLGGIIFTNINRFQYYINKKVLFYELNTGGYLVIEISGNGKEITDDILNDATNFVVNEIDN